MAADPPDPRGLPQLPPVLRGRRLLFWAVLLPLVLLATASAVLEMTTLDVAISQACYDQFDGWFPARDTRTCLLLYRFGCYPGLILGVGGLLLAAVSVMVPDWRKAGKHGLLLAAILLIGPGLVVNTFLKPYWGRSRPDDTERFGGTKAFTPFWLPGADYDGHSFPSGHASMGFYLMAPGFLLWRFRRRLAIGFLCLGCTYGLTMGLCRVVQGRHFVSDVLWSGAIVYFTCMLVYTLFLRSPAASFAMGAESPDGSAAAPTRARRSLWQKAA